MEDCCAVCAEPVDWVGYGPCGHREVCFMCVVRMRFILNDKQCCICKQDCPTVYVTRALGEYTRIVTEWEPLVNHSRSSALGNLWHNDVVDAYFDDEEPFKIIEAMCGLYCSICEGAPEGAPIAKDMKTKGYAFRNLNALVVHQARVHKVFMCKFCLEGRKAFVSEQKLYTKSHLRKHIWKGNVEVDGDESFTGHPPCDFCREPFYDDNELYLHMSREHYTCHLCQRLRPEQHEYYRNYDELQHHFREMHSLCENEECLGKKFVVFLNEAELRRHNASAHPGRTSRSQRNADLQIPVTLEYRRPTSNYNTAPFSHRRRGRGIPDSRTDQPSVAEDLYLGDLQNALRELANTAIATTQPGNESRGINSQGGIESPSSDHQAGGLSQPAGDVQIGHSRFLAAALGGGLSSGIDNAAFPPLPSASPSTPQFGNPRFLTAVAGGGRSPASGERGGDEAFPPLPGASQNTQRQPRVRNQNSPSIVSAILNANRSGRTARSGVRILNKADHRSSRVPPQSSRSIETTQAVNG